jgi:hypothetical protein
MGPPKFFDASLPACHGLWTPADLHILANTDDLVLPSVCVKTLGIRNKRRFEAVPALQGTRLPLRPTGFSVYASSILFAVFPRLRHGRKTRYGWVASPYPTGTFTLQETPSLLGAVTLSVRRGGGAERNRRRLHAVVRGIMDDTSGVGTERGVALGHTY